MLHENTDFKLAVHCSSTWQIQLGASCKESCTTERCSQPLLCQAGSPNKQKRTREVISSVKDFYQLRDPMFDLKTQSRGSIYFQTPFQMGGLNQLLLGMKPSWAASLWRAAKKQSEFVFGMLLSRVQVYCSLQMLLKEEAGQNRHMRLSEREGKVCSTSKIRGIALLLKTRLQVS